MALRLEWLRKYDQDFQLKNKPLAPTWEGGAADLGPARPDTGGYLPPAQIPSRPRLTAMESTGAAPKQFAGRGYPDTDGGTIIPEGLTREQSDNMRTAGGYRSQLPPRLRQIATVTPGSDVPTIQGADLTRLNQAAAATAARPQLDPTNVRDAFQGQRDPLAEKKAAEAAMGGRTIEDVVKSMERRTPRGTLQSAARLDERDLRMADANRNADADRRTALDVETRKGRTALDVETRKGKNEADSLRAGIDAQRQDDLIRRELKIERPQLPGRDQVTDAYLDGVRRGASAALRQPEGTAATPGDYPENAAKPSGQKPAQPAAPPPDPDEGKFFTQNGVRYVKRNGQYVRA